MRVSFGDCVLDARAPPPRAGGRRGQRHRARTRSVTGHLSSIATLSTAGGSVSFVDTAFGASGDTGTVAWTRTAGEVTQQVAHRFPQERPPARRKSRNGCRRGADA